MSAIDNGYRVHRGREGGAAETPDDAAFRLGARGNKYIDVIWAAVGNGRGKSVVAIFWRHKIVAAIVLQLHCATSAQNSHDADVDGMEDSRAYHRYVSHIGCSGPGTEAHGAGLVGTGRLPGNRNLIGSVDGDEYRECKHAILRYRQSVHTIVLQSKTGTSGISGNRASNGKRSKRTGDLNSDGDACRGCATAVGDSAGLRRAGRLGGNRNIIGLTEGDGSFELGGSSGPGNRKELGAILQNQAGARQAGNRYPDGLRTCGARYHDGGDCGCCSATASSHCTGLRWRGGGLRNRNY